MTAWPKADYELLAGADEVDVASERPDGSLSPRVTIWVVGHGGALYLRSWKGPERPWYRAVRERAVGRMWAGSLERDVRFKVAGPGVEETVDSAFRAKYGRQVPYVDDMVREPARGTTLRVNPR